MLEQFSLTKKTVFITGAANGIGKACALAMADAGAQLFLSDINQAQCDDVIAQLKSEGINVAGCQHDVSNEEHWVSSIQTCLKVFGAIDCLVNNAGTYLGGTLVSNNLEAIHTLQKVNVDSVFLGMKHAALAMRADNGKGRGGSIVNMSSVAGLIGVPGHSSYGATKGAVKLYTKHAAVEFARLGYGIRVNSVHPGLIDTAMGEQVFDDFVEIGMAANIEEATARIHEMTPMGRLGTVQDVANTVVFLASEASAYCTGAEFVVDGGMSAA